MKIKKNIKIWIILCGFFLLGSAFLFYHYIFIFRGVKQFSDVNEIELSIRTGDEMRSVSLWHESDSIGYFFLPAYTELEKCCFVYQDSECVLRLDGDVLPSKKYLDKFFYNTEYTLYFQDVNGDTLTTQVQFLCSDKLPAVYLTTESDSLLQIHEDKEYREKTHMEIVDEKGEIVYQDDIEYLKGHGNHTWELEKKPYQIKLNENAALLGMDAGKKWILLANYFDKSYVRNAIVHDLATAVGMPYTSQMEYVDLYINNEYRGNYQLAEKIDTASGRVEINDLEKDNKLVNELDYKKNDPFGEWTDIVKGLDGMNNPKDITGGYLLERNYGKKYAEKVSGFITEADERFVVRSPAYASKEEIAYIYSVTQSVENAIFSADGIDEKTNLHYSQLIDVESFVNKYLLEEIVLNAAMAGTSSWFYKPENEISTKLYAGPVWDYDKACGNSESCANPHVLSKLACYRIAPTEWFYKLYEKEEFHSKVKSNYKELFLPEIERVIEDKIDYYDQYIAESVSMDQIRWGRKGTDSFAKETDYLKEWLQNRVDYLNQVWIEENEVCLIRYLNSDGHVDGFDSVPLGQCIEKLHILTDKEEADALAYWYNEKNETPICVGDVVTEDMVLVPIMKN